MIMNIFIAGFISIIIHNNIALTKILGSLHHILKCDPCTEQHYFNFLLDSLLRKKLSEQLQVSSPKLSLKGILQF